MKIKVYKTGWYSEWDKKNVFDTQVQNYFGLPLLVSYFKIKVT